MVKRILNQEGPFRILIGIVLVAGSVVTYVLALLFTRQGTCPIESNKEYFANERGERGEKGEKGEKDGSFGSILSTINRVSGILLQPSTWTERIEMHTLSPVDLARRYLKSQATVEDGTI